MVEETKARSGWPIQQTLAVLEISRSSYHRWKQAGWAVSSRPRSSPGSMYQLLPEERQAIVAYALAHPEIRHRELAWRMVDEGICCVSPASVYRVLGEAGLVCRWKPKARPKGEGRSDRPSRPDALWETDIKYVRVGERNYYLLSFMDVYSRYIVHHRLLRCMDGQSVSTEAAAALATLDRRAEPVIQSDHGSGFLAREFAETLSEFNVTHKKIRPHTPTDNAEIERFQRTIGEKLDEHELADYTQAQDVIAEIIGTYNTARLHSALSFLRPVDYYRGDPEALVAERRRKLQQARELRKQENLKLRQRLLPWTEAKTVA
jgi:transposase InsO family protein